eukprot:TRINITY_DN17123_c0_g1_i1.p1 TRINITY_DN17123_c0_g1~~TRINITY_DN17123_c0_g1_i1.p1  ORF type:complete len:742 (-),score=128.77 TRINITY_DN17123_c0_g1_i1:108-2117(-)
MILRDLPSLLLLSSQAGKALVSSGRENGYLGNQDELAAMEKPLKDLADEFEAAKEEMSGPCLVYTLLLCSNALQAHNSLKNLGQFSWADEPTLLKKMKSWWLKLCFMLGIWGVQRSPTHFRYVLRSTASIVFAFLVGLLGAIRPFPAYSNSQGNSASIILALGGSFAGSSVSVTLRMTNAFLIGYVTGSMIQNLLAFQTPFHASCYALALWAFNASCTFGLLHTSHRPLVFMMQAQAVYRACPPGAMMKVYGQKFNVESDGFLFGNLKAAVMGGLVLLLTDVFIVSSATRQAWQRLTRCQKRLTKLFALVLCQENASARSQTLAEIQGMFSDLSELKALSPQAAAEPSLKGSVFPLELFQQMQEGMYEVTKKLQFLDWASNQLEKATISDKGSIRVMPAEEFSHRDPSEAKKAEDDVDEMLVDNLMSLQSGQKRTARPSEVIHHQSNGDIMEKIASEFHQVMDTLKTLLGSLKHKNDSQPNGEAGSKQKEGQILIEKLRQDTGVRRRMNVFRAGGSAHSTSPTRFNLAVGRLQIATAALGSAAKAATTAVKAVLKEGESDDEEIAVEEYVAGDVISDEECLDEEEDEHTKSAKSIFENAIHKMKRTSQTNLGSSSSPLKDLYEQLRRKNMRNRGSIPVHDPMSHVELAIFLLEGMEQQMSKLEMLLLLQ